MGNVAGIPIVGWRCWGGGCCSIHAPFGSGLRYVDELELEAVGVVEEHRVVAGHVLVLLRAALDLGVAGAQPLRTLVDDRAGGSLEGQVVEADGIAVVLARRVVARRLRLS